MTDIDKRIDEIKPCPFCGGKAVKYRNKKHGGISAGCISEICPAEHWSLPINVWNNRPLEKHLQAQVVELKAHAIYQDCGRICDSNSEIDYKEQWERSTKYVENLIQATINKAGEW